MGLMVETVGAGGIDGEIKGWEIRLKKIIK